MLVLLVSLVWRNSRFKASTQLLRRVTTQTSQIHQPPNQDDPASCNRFTASFELRSFVLRTATWLCYKYNGLCSATEPCNADLISNTHADWRTHLQTPASRVESLDRSIFPISSSFFILLLPNYERTASMSLCQMVERAGGFLFRTLCSES